MKARRLLGLVLGAALAAVACPLAAAPPTSFTTRYDFLHNSFLLAKMERTLRPTADGRYIYESKYKPAGILAAFINDHIEERSVWIPTEHGPQPLSYQYHQTGGREERHVVLDFDWDKHVVVNNVNSEPWRMTIPDGAQDKLLYQYAMMRDLQAGRPDLEYEIADGGTLKTYRFERVGREKLNTPIGWLDTVKLERVAGSRRTVVWCAVDLSYLPVRLEQHKDDKTLTMVIREVEGIPRGEQALGMKNP